jgi:hypothetical protein
MRKRTLLVWVSLWAAATGVSAEVVPEPVPPVYSRLKDLHLATSLVEDGAPRATIVSPASGIYKEAAARVQSAVRRIAGVVLPVASDDSPAGAVPVQGNLIVLGNRSTNASIRRLYDLYYCILDLKYPGPGGYNVRTLHSPFGDGRNVILLGGSDEAGVAAAAEAFASILQSAGGRAGELSVGYLMEIRLGKGTRFDGLREWDFAKQEAYGWNMVSRQMAMYYLTGREEHAREILRYAFPDSRTREELRKTEFIDYRDSPLAEGWDYHSHLMSVFWDLVEESPVFTDEQRLKITNALARQLLRRKTEAVYYRTEDSPKVAQADMHSAYSAICLHALGRYFQKDYPHPVWRQCLRAARLYFTSFHDDAQFALGTDNLQWFPSEVEAILTYTILAGWREPLESGALQRLLRAQEALISGLPDEWALEWASPAYLNKAAHVTGDGRWSGYRDRTRLDWSVLRLGQSFWPEERPRPPLDLAGNWNVWEMPDAHRRARETGFAAGEAFYFGSYRSAPDATGDYILLDGYNGEARNPYHAFTISALRLGGRTLLQGYRNQVLISADGLVEPRLALDGALKYAGVVGRVAVAVGEVPQMSWSSWRRTLAQHTGRYALVVDDVTFRSASDGMSVETLWETTGDTWRPDRDCLEIPAGNAAASYEVCMSDALEHRRDAVSRAGWSGPSAEDRLEFRRDPVSRFSWYGPVKPGDRQIRFSLIAPSPAACLRVADNAAAVALPAAALAVSGTYEATAGETVLLAEDHLFGHNLTRAGLSEAIFTATRPVDVLWDFSTGSLDVVAAGRTVISMRAARGRFDLAPGRHRIAGAFLDRAAARRLSTGLLRKLDEGRIRRSRLKLERVTRSPEAPSLRPLFTAALGKPVADLALAGSVIHAAAGDQVRRFLPDGTELPPFSADAGIRVLAWWPEHRLLLAGCTDDRVIAFDEAGRRRWVFVSEKDPRLYGPGDDGPFTWLEYWPKLTGIHGLFTGKFLDGGTQAFAGSTNTLDILSGDGKLLKRLPVLRGMVRRFALLDMEPGRRRLLLAREPSDWDTLTVIDNTDLKPEPEGFHDLPPGHRIIWAWMQNRPVYLAAADLDGDAAQEVVAAIDGIWNRVSIWDREGKPRASVNFPPGEGPLYRNLPGVEIGDLEGDGKAEILVATAGRGLVALDHRCERIWSRRLPATPTLLQFVPASTGQPSAIVVGQEDGSLLVFDGKGRIVGQARVEGRPARAALLPRGDHGPMLVIATDSGHVAFFPGAHP